MQRIKYVMLVLLVALATLAISGQNAGRAANQGAEQAGSVAAQPSALRVITPKSGEKLRQDFVTVQVELAKGGVSAAATPSFRLRLDSRDPVTTSATEYTFTGLTPGAHTLDVQLVDANNTPIPGAHTEVQFVTIPTAPSAHRRGLKRLQPRLIQAALRIGGQRDPAPEGGQELPSAGGALPLLSVIGFGVLLGGIASAMKTR